MTDKLYPATLVRGDSGAIGVSFPDFPGCVTVGDTVDEAANLAEEALSLHIEGMLEDSESLPEATAYEDARPYDPDADVLGTILVRAEVPSRSVRIDLSLDDDLLARIDRSAREAGMSRAEFVAASARAAVAALSGRD